MTQPVTAHQQQASPKSRSRLGRGLSSLISMSDLPVEAEVKPPQTTPVEQPVAPEANDHTAAGSRAPNGMIEVPIDSIAPNPHQPRRQMNDASLAELAASLRATGLIQPVIVRKVESGYELIAGERRLRAARLAGLSTIPALVREVDAAAQAQMALVENIHRENLNPIDRALAYRALMNQLGLTQVELAARLGEDRTSIAHYLRLLDLAEPVRNLVRDGRLSLGHAKLLAGVSDILQQQRLADMCVTQELSVRGLERLLAGKQPPAAASRNKPSSAHLQHMEKAISRQLGMRVQLRAASKTKGRLVIHYASLDQFDELLKRMGVHLEE
ncbi:ParB/RepB/Spo0J family partition protein [Fontivita pretiosa]|uniref:ParB/RepB/Spo0J family partition protein n=1 Tax=Fontivita pretiosa TaxID=2989684 RepID=UPI003D17E2DF